MSWETLTDITTGLSDEARQEVAKRRAEALGYVWGWQDRTGEMDSEQAWEFSLAYAVHAAEYAASRRGYRRNVRDAFGRWLATGKIEGKGE